MTCQCMAFSILSVCVDVALKCFSLASFGEAKYGKDKHGKRCIPEGEECYACWDSRRNCFNKMDQKKLDGLCQQISDLGAERALSRRTNVRGEHTTASGRKKHTKVNVDQYVETKTGGLPRWLPRL